MPPNPGYLLNHVESSKAGPGKSFLELPIELRLMIYEQAFRHDGEQEDEASGSTIKYLREQTVPFVVLLRTCRQIHAEAAPILFGKNCLNLGMRFVHNFEDPAVPRYEDNIFNPFLRYTDFEQAVRPSLYAPLVRIVRIQFASQSNDKHTMWETMLRRSQWLTRNFKHLKEIRISMNFIYTREWANLLEPKSRDESRGMHVLRLRKWMREMYVLKQLKLPKCVKIRLEPSLALIYFMRLPCEIVRLPDNFDNFYEAVELFKARQR